MFNTFLLMQKLFELLSQCLLGCFCPSLLWFEAAPSSGEFREVEGENEERRRARLERHQRTQERAVCVTLFCSLI